MHELLLFGQVPAAHHELLLKILAGVAAMQPRPILERHLIFKPQRTPGQNPVRVGGTQGVQSAQVQAFKGQLQGELFYLQLVSDVDRNDFGSPALNSNGVSNADDDEKMADVHHEDTNGHVTNATRLPAGRSWTLRFYDLPEVAGRRPVTSRGISSVDILDGNLINFMKALGYDFISEHIIEGHQFVHNNVVAFLHRVLRFPSAGHTIDAPRTVLPPYESLEPVDVSGTYLLQASVRVQDGNSPESMDLGSNELKGFKETMRGIVDLDLGDRLALDTRVK